MLTQPSMAGAQNDTVSINSFVTATDIHENLTSQHWQQITTLYLF